MARIEAKRGIPWLLTNWIYAVAPIVVGVAYAFHSLYFRDGDHRQGEVIVIAYWCIFVPSLFAIFFRKLPAKQLSIRLLAAACAGLWLAGLTVPDYAKQLLKDWWWIRYMGLALLIVVEVRALIVVIRILLGKSESQADLEHTGVPPFFAKLMMAEARFWRLVWTWVSGKRAK